MSPILTTGAGRYGTVSAPATTTWDGSVSGTTISPLITLTNGGLTATANANTGTPGVRAVAAHSTGKYYFEAHIDAYSTNWWIGICDGSEAPGFGPGINDNHGAGYRASDGLCVFQGFTTLGNAVAASVGDTVSVAVDTTATLIWFRVNNGNWNNNGSANPDTGVGGFNFSGGGLTAPFFPMFSGGGNLGDATTANFGGSGYAQTRTNTSLYGNW